MDDLFPLSWTTWAALWWAALVVGHLLACRIERARLGHPSDED